MTGNQAFAILLKKLKSVASGVKGVAVDPSDDTKLVFTLLDNSVIKLSIPNPVLTVAICNKLSVDTTTNELMYDGVKICKCDFTADQLALLKKFTVGADGSLFYNGSPLAMLTQQERDAITDITTNIKFNKDAGGNIESVEIGGATIKKTTSASGEVAVKVGDVVVSGQETTTTTNSYNDANGNPVAETIVTVKTPTGTEQTKTVDSINPDNGNSINTAEVIKGGAEGINVGSASGTKTTTATDGTGVVIDTKVEDVIYENGNEINFVTADEVQDIVDGLGWDM